MTIIINHLAFNMSNFGHPSFTLFWSNLTQNFTKSVSRVPNNHNNPKKTWQKKCKALIVGGGGRTKEGMIMLTDPMIF